MIILHIDTTAEYSFIRLSTNLETVMEESWLSEKKLGEDLLPKIVTLLKRAQLEPNDLDCISVNAGPGSFTGTRVGVSCANALAWSLDIPVIASDVADKLSTPELSSTLRFSKPVVPKYATPPKVTLRKE